MDSRERAALDAHITGNYGQDQLNTYHPDDLCDCGHDGVQHGDGAGTPGEPCWMGHDPDCDNGSGDSDCCGPEACRCAGLEISV